MKVTAKNLNTLPDGVHTIQTGLYVKVQKGRSYFLFKYTDAFGKRKDVSLGSTKKITLKEAKAIAGEYQGRVLKGLPLKETLKDKPSKQTVEEFFNATIETIIEVKKYKNETSCRALRSLARRYVYPVIGKRDIRTVDRNTVLLLLKPIWYEKPTAAKHLLELLRAVLTYAVTENLLAFNPAIWSGNLDMYLPRRSKVYTPGHYKAASLEAVRALFSEAPKCPAHRAALFGILTATRKVEFVGARWEEIDLENAVWLIPPERRKDGRLYPHRVPLSEQAIRLLNSLEVSGSYIFTSGKDKPISLSTPGAWARRRSRGTFTMHGMRSVFRDWCAENGVPDILAEKSLMHATGNAVVQAYQRSDLLEQRREVMQRWADAVCSRHAPLGGLTNGQTGNGSK